MKTRLPIFLLLFVWLATTPLAVAAPLSPSAAATPVNNGPYGGDILQLANDPADSAGLYAAVREVGLFHSADRGAHWAFLFSGVGPQGNFAIDAVDPAVLYVTHPNDGLYRSQDSGATWSAIPLPADVPSVFSVRAFAHPTTAGTLYAALSYSNRLDECGDHCGLYRSTDYGDNWTWLGASPLPADVKINALAFLPGDPSVVYAGADDGAIYRSADGGETWVFADNPLSHVSKLVFDPAGVLYVLGSGEGVSLPMVRCEEESDTFGVTLNCRTLGDPNYVLIDTASSTGDGSNQPSDLKVNPANADDLLVSTGYHLARSLDAGLTWTFYDHVSSPSQATAALYDLADPDALFAGNAQGVWQTGQANAADYATSVWQEQDESLAGVVPSTIVSAPSDPLVVYVNANSGIYRTTDGALTWERLPAFCDGDWCYLLNTPLAVDPTDAGHLVLAAWNYTVQLSEDGGDTWTEITGLPQPTTLPALDPGKEYVISIHDLIAVPGSPAVYLAAVAFHDPDNPDFKVYAAGGIYRSVDGGHTWALEVESSDWSASRLAYDPGDPARIYAGACSLTVGGACDHAAVLSSTDGGQLWQPLTPADSILTAIEDAGVLVVRPTDGRLYVASGSAVIWIDPGGSAWNWGGSVPVSYPINQLLFDPATMKSGRVLYAATAEGLFVSQTAGEDFARDDSELGHAAVTAMAAAHDPAGQNYLFVGTAGGQFSEGGLTLSAANDHLVAAGVYRVTGQEYATYLPAILR